MLDVDSTTLACSNNDAQDLIRRVEARHVSRDQAVDSDARAGEPVPLALLWQALTEGVCRVVDSFFTSKRCYVVTAGLAARGRPPVEGRKLEILERVLSGSAQNAVGLDLGLAPSTIAQHTRVGLDSLGIACRSSRVHPLLMLAAKAARDRDLSQHGSLSVVLADGTALRVIGVARPDACLIDVLPQAELAVVSGQIEGHSLEDIARQRGTSVRTVANQVAAVFRRLGVSGRNELVHRLFADTAGTARPLPPLALPAPDWGQLQLAAS